ncbi:LysR family transcriptional regulator [Sphingorhabdus sp.]|uniref:LysR family transcriptional regulator n=1 Tax=Sphingorhabdus sp. TaxID=1902408 RepID=UPI003593CA15
MQATDWNDYHVFIVVAQTGQIARAAKKLGVDATTIGRRLRRLEAQFGATLFEQTREGQALTEAGESLLASIEIMASAADNAVPKQNAEHGPGGTLRISVSEGFGSWFLTRHIPDFLSRFPNMKIDLVASNGFLSPSKREADIAVVLSRPKAGQVIAQKLSSYKLCLYASQSYAHAHGLPEKPADLATGHRLISYIPDLLYAPELNYLDEILPGLQPTIRSSSINAQHRLIASGTGMGVLPCFIGDTDPTLIALRSFGSIDRNFWLVTHRDNNGLARIRAGKDWLLEIVQRDRHIINPAF